MGEDKRPIRDIEIDSILGEFSTDGSGKNGPHVSDETLDGILAEILVNSPASARDGKIAPSDRREGSEADGKAPASREKGRQNIKSDNAPPKRDPSSDVRLDVDGELDDPLKVDEKLIESIPTWEERHSREYLEKNPDDPINKIKKMSGVKATESFLNSLKKRGGIRKESSDVIYERPEEDRHTRVIDFRDKLRTDTAPNGQLSIDGFGDEKTGVWDAVNVRSDGENDRKPNRTAAFKDDGEYHSSDDAEEVGADLKFRKKLLSAQCVTAGIAAVILLILAFSPWLGSLFDIFVDNPKIYLILTAVLTGLSAGVAGNVVFGGIIKIFRGRITADTVAASVVLPCFVQNIIMIFRYDRFLGSIYQNIYCCTAVFALLVILFGKRATVSTCLKNFNIIRDRDEKYPLESHFRDDEALELGRGLSIGDRKVCIMRKSRDISDFIYHSCAADPCLTSGKRIMLASLIVSLAAGALCFFWPGKGELRNLLDSFTAFCAALCVTCPFMLTVSGGGVLKKAAKDLRREGIMLSGFDAVEDFRDTDIIALDAGDLFPENCVTLKGIKSASNQTLDRSIMDVAGIIDMSGGPLRPVFSKILQNNKALVPDVDTIVYEEEMGISGWVSGHRVLVGNRRLLENHGVTVPDDGYEEQYEGTGIKPVYLSAGGELSAVFLVQYKPDRAVGDALRAAVKKGMAVAVYSCDPNVTSKLICRLYRLPVGSVRVMGTAARHVYKKLTNRSSKPVDGELLCDGKTDSALWAVLACRRIGKTLSFTRAVQLICALVGSVLSLGMVYTSGAHGLSAAAVLVFQIASLVVTRGLSALGV